jgi:hypothetical protein
MSHWLIALMNEGKYRGPPAAGVLKATIQPAIAQPNTLAEVRDGGRSEPAYGMAARQFVPRAP